MGLVFGLGKGAGSFFADMSGVSDAEISAYEGLQSGFDQVLLALLPTNIVGDLSSNNVVAIIIIAVAFAIAYVSIVSDEGEKGVKAFKDLVEAVKKVLYRVLRYVINLTPYAALCLIATSAAQFISDRDAMMQLLLLLVLVYACGFFHEYVLNIPLIKFAAKLKPLKFFKKILPAQITAFSTSSSVGTIPVSVEGLTKRVGVDEEVANFTVPLGATIGMPGCTAVWPILLAIFYVNATGLNWGVGEYIMLGVLALVLSFGVAGVPGIGVVSAISLFSAVHLPVAAVIMMLPINTITDMIRTMMNVTTANVSATIVARQTGLLDDSVFENANDKEA